MPEKGREAIEGVIIIINLRKTLAAVVLVIGGFLSFQTALGPGSLRSYECEDPRKTKP